MKLLLRPSSGVWLLPILFLALCGCQNKRAEVVRQHVDLRQSMMAWSGLGERANYQILKVQGATPRDWQATPLIRTPLFEHQQWRAPSKRTGLGVAHILMPVPLPASAVIWFAKQHYSNERHDGELLAEWTDAAGRPWFEARNNKYHVIGYAITSGFDAWIVYHGYKTAFDPDPLETSLAQRAVETFIPLPMAGDLPETSTAQAH